MDLWQIWGITGLALLILEIFTPFLFFLNLSIAALITAIFSFYVDGINLQVGIFVLFSVILLLFARPLLLRNKSPNGQTGIEAKYIGNIARVTKKITANDGRATIYGEAWDTRSANGEEIEEGESVKIIKVEDLTLYVEKI